jgi:hypothetical protein
MNKPWRIAGSSKSGNAVRITIRAADYFEARAIGRKAKIEIRDIVLMESMNGQEHEQNRLPQRH